MSKNTIVLGYHDSLLRCTDVELLEKNRWLNDNLIGFIYEYYEYEKYRDFPEFLFVNPSLVQIVKFTEADELDGFIGGWFSKSLVLIPINNNNEQLHAGGTHWSLLVLYPREASCCHLDSAGHCNHDTAHMLAQKIGHTFQATTGKKLQFKDALSAQQYNAYDCGIYVISNTELVCDHYLKHRRSIRHTQMNDVIPTSEPSDKRKQIKQLIHRLSKDKPSSL